MTDKKYDTKILAFGFEEGCYNSDNNYGNIEGSKMNDNIKQCENIEEMVKDSEILLNCARAY